MAADSVGASGEPLGAWRIPPDGSPGGALLPVEPRGVPTAMDDHEMYIGAAACVVGAMLMGSQLLSNGETLSAAIWSAAFAIVGYGLVRHTRSGLAVGSDGLRVRKLFSTVHLRWADIERIEVRTPAFPLNEWESVCIVRPSRRAVHVLGMRRPVKWQHAPKSPSAEEVKLWLGLDEAAAELDRGRISHQH